MAERSRADVPPPARLRPVLAAGAAALAVVLAAPAEADPEARDALEASVEAEQALLDSLAAVEARIDALGVEIAEISAREVEANARLAAAEAAERKAEVELGDQLDRLQDHAVAAYVSGHPGEVAGSEVLAALGAEEPLDLGRIHAYGTSVVTEQDEVVDGFIAAEAEAAAARRAADDARAALEAELARREQLLAEQEAARAEQEALLAEAQVRRDQVEAGIAAEAAESDAIGGQIAAAQASQPLALPRPTSLVWPTAAGEPIGSEFGPRFHPILNSQRLHKGADIGCSTGEALLAVTAGVVVVAAQRGGYGNTVVLDHGGGFATLYAHASALLVSPGQAVTAGQPVARCGSTGLSTGPHLHFETRVDGAPVDPRTFL